MGGIDACVVELCMRARAVCVWLMVSGEGGVRGGCGRICLRFKCRKNYCRFLRVFDKNYVLSNLSALVYIIHIILGT